MKTLFGLPEKVIHCTKCLLTNQKPFSVNETKIAKDHQKILCNLMKKNLSCASILKKEKIINWMKRETFKRIIK